MNYSLGNTLSRGGALNPDGLSLDLQFATDKTLTARKGPTPTFTRASTATFVGSDGLIQSAAINQARFDHDPVTLASKGLLIEESRTNTRIYSEDFSQAVYGSTGVSIASVAGTSPSGGATIQKLVEDTSTGAHGIAFSNASGIQTCSIFCKSAGRQWARINGNAVNTWFDLQNGVIGTVGLGHTALITNFGNGWYRCSISFTETGLGGILVRASTADNILVYTGDGTSGILLWGAQVEAAAFPTSYIPTTTASVVRSADVCSITGSAFTGMYNSTEGTLFAQHFYSLNNLGRPIHISDGSSATNAIEIFNGAGPSCNVFSAGSQQYTRNVTATTNTVAKSSLAIATSNAMFCVNGTLATSGGGLMPIGVNQLNIGNRPDGTRPLNGHVAHIRYYKKRLSNAKLQTLTT